MQRGLMNGSINIEDKNGNIWFGTDGVFVSMITKLLPLLQNRVIFRQLHPIFLKYQIPMLTPPSDNLPYQWI